MSKCFIAFRVPTPNSECHITIGVNHSATEEIAQQMSREFDQLIRPHFPIQMEICNYNARGADNSMPAYDVRFKDSAVQKITEDFYRRH